MWRVAKKMANYLAHVNLFVQLLTNEKKYNYKGGWHLKNSKCAVHEDFAFLLYFVLAWDSWMVQWISSCLCVLGFLILDL